MKTFPVLPSHELISYPLCRVCPGKHMAYVSAWTAIARLLACFDIKATEETAKALPEEATENPTRYFESGLVL
jgi:cytochrome P450